MPHLVLQHSNNLLENSFHNFFNDVHIILSNSLNSNIEKCRSRVIPLSNYYIADGDIKHAFIHLDIYIKSGKPPELIRSTGQMIFSKLNDYVTGSKSNLIVQSSIEFHEVGCYYIN